MDNSIIASAIAKAAKSAIKVENTPEPPKIDTESIEMNIPEYYNKPTVHLNSKDFSGVKDFYGGNKVTLCMECLIRNTEFRETVDEKGNKQTNSSACLEILSIADITDFKK